MTVYGDTRGNSMPPMAFFKTQLGKMRLATPMWGNGRRYGLRLKIFAVSLLFAA